MMDLCLEICEQKGFMNANTYKLGRDLTTGLDISPHYQVYCTLTQELRRRWGAGVELHELEEAPRGGRAWIEKHISTEEDRENLNFFTGAAWQHLDLPADVDNRYDNEGNFDVEEDCNLYSSPDSDREDMIKYDNNADLPGLEDILD